MPYKRNASGNFAIGRARLADGLESRAGGYAVFRPLHSARSESQAAHGRRHIAHTRLRATSHIRFHDVHVGPGTIRARNKAAPGKHDGLTASSIVAAIVLPVALALALAAMDMRTDLSELKPAGHPDDTGAVQVGWPDLKQHGDFPGRVRILGYMMQEQTRASDGDKVDIFLLLPEAGNILRQPPRIPDQTIVVWSSFPVFFRKRELVWASGTLSRTIRKSGRNQPDWAMTFAEVIPAASRDITNWLRP